MILIDTDVCIELLNGNKKVLQRRNEYDDPIGISFMSVAELYYGAEKSSNPSKNHSLVEALLLSLEIVQTDLSILKRFGMIKAPLVRSGTTIADADILVAATAMEKGSKLITGNMKHFQRIPGLVLENWTS